MNIHTLQVLVLVLGYPLVLWAAWRARRRAVARARQDERQATERAFMTASEMLTNQLADVSLEVERAREVAGAAEAKTARYLAKISDFEKERTKWQELYYSQSIGHGNAQQLMMGVIEDFAGKLQRLNVRVQLPRVLHAVRDDYLSNHEMPARAAMEAIETARAQIPEAPPAAEATSPVTP